MGDLAVLRLQKDEEILHVLRRSACALTRFLRVLRLMRAVGSILIIQSLFLNVLYDRLRDQVANAHVALAE